MHDKKIQAKSDKNKSMTMHNFVFSKQTHELKNRTHSGVSWSWKHRIPGIKKAFRWISIFVEKGIN